MQVKHTWGEEVVKHIFSESFTYQLTMRGALTQQELDVINKYDAMNAWVYSNREERDGEKVKTTLDDHWLQHAAAGWHNARVQPFLEFSMADLLKGVVVKNDNPYYLDSVFNEVSKSCSGLLDNLFGLDELFNGEENVTEVYTHPNQSD